MEKNCDQRNFNAILLSCSCPYLLMVLNAHADGVDQNGDHDASVEVFALHDSPQLHACVVPQFLASLLRITSHMFACTFLALLALLFVTRTNPIPVRFFQSSLLCFILCIAKRSHPISWRQSRGALRATVCGRGGSEGHGWGMVWLIMMGTRRTWKGVHEAG